MKFTERVGFSDGLTNPYFNNKDYVGSTGGYAYCKENGKTYQCVNYVIGRQTEISEQKICYYGSQTPCKKPLFNRKGYGNAKEWWDSCLWEKSLDNVQLGDIVVYGSSWGGGFGHVRVVEKIQDNYMYLSGGNEDGKGSVKFNIKVPITKGGGSNAKGLMGYIHNPYLNKVDYEAKYKELLADMGKIKSIVSKY